MKLICGGGGAGGRGLNKVHYGQCENGEFGYLRKQPLSEPLETPLDEMFYPWGKKREMESLGGNE